MGEQTARQAQVRIIFYNWVQFDDPEKRGGGVTLYQRNLIEALLAEGHEVLFLSSGIAYNLLTKRSYIRRTRNIFGARCKSFELVNSPILAPSHNSFDTANASFNDTRIRPILLDFLRKHGPFDVVHFNNLEGLPLAAIDIKQEFPDTRFVFSAHNYFAVCPQVNLWQNEARNCVDFEGGRKCVTCLVTRPNQTEERLANALAFHLKCLGILPETPLFRSIFHLARLGHRVVSSLIGLLPKPAPTQVAPRPPGDNAAPAFAQRRACLIRLVEESFDTILAVSARTRTVLTRFGFSPERVEISYIGTRHGQLFSTVTQRPTYENTRPLRVAYLGYMRADKGFWFLLDALEAMPAPLAAQIELVIAARDTGKGGKARLDALAPKFRKINHFDGYTQESIGTVLQNTDIGIVPPLWEDNLPQVAIEIVSRGIPILTSDAGGAQELGNNPAFTFASGSVDALHDRLEQILEGRLDLSDFWQQSMAPKSMQEHLADLMQHYQPASGVAAAAE